MSSGGRAAVLPCCRAAVLRPQRPPRTLGNVKWREEQDHVEEGVRERAFDVATPDGPEPGLLWTPADADTPRPLVLIGHGASASKREPHVVSLARHLAGHRRFAAAAIDGPVHGDRRSDQTINPMLTFLEFSQAWAMDDGMTDAMVVDWRCTIDELQLLDEIGDGPVGWWGLSMGTILGLPLVAAEPRIAVAVLGLMGLTGPTRARIAEDAPRVRCPVLFLAQADDELFPVETALALFQAIGAEDKRLHLQPGRHGQVPTEEFEASEAFLARHLG